MKKLFIAHHREKDGKSQDLWDHLQEVSIFAGQFAAKMGLRDHGELIGLLHDFALVQGTRRLNIEIDGEKYHRNWDGELCRRDQIRNQRLIELGWDIMRFWVYQVRDDLDYCIDQVQNWLDTK